MATDLKKTQGPYATLTVATYEPLIVRWISAWSLHLLAIQMSKRTLPKSLEKTLSSKVEIPALLQMSLAGQKALQIGTAPEAGPENAIPVIGGRDVRQNDQEELRRKAEFAIFDALVDKLNTSVKTKDGKLDTAFREALKEIKIKDSEEKEIDFMADKMPLFDFLPVFRLEEALSPLGITHLYRQIYFNREESVGPIEQAFTIAPGEQLEVLVESTRRQLHEEAMELGSEQVSETATEEKDLDEITDKSASMMQRDFSASFSANASGGFLVWQVGAAASTAWKDSTQKNREEVRRRVKEVTRKASERITKTFSLRTRNVTETTDRNLMRRLLRNDSPTDPISYGLRRIMRTVLVKVQDLGPRLVWQIYIRNPGMGLAQSQFVHIRDSTLSMPEIPPGCPPRPQGGSDTGTTEVTVTKITEKPFIIFKIFPPPGRDIISVSVDSMRDLDGGDKGDVEPSAATGGTVANQNDGTFQVTIPIFQGTASRVSVSYSYHFEPSSTALKAWEDIRLAKVAELQEEAAKEKFERERMMITARSKIRPRPANDLRREERFEVMNRLVSHFTRKQESGKSISELEIETFHRYFDLEAMFVYNHPSWWKPRLITEHSSLERKKYEITAESEPAPMGSSLGWLLQLDGDTRRNEIINSPWCRVCLPIKPHLEREALWWLMKNFEGQLGFPDDADVTKDRKVPLELLEKMVADMEALRLRQIELQRQTSDPEFVAVDTKPVPPSAVENPDEWNYPVIDFRL